MKKLVMFFLLAAVLVFPGCTRVTPRAGAGIGVGLGIDFTRKVPVRPYITGGIGAGFRFF